MSGGVAALYVRADSVYHRLPGVDAYDAARDARSYAGPWPVVAHPPCRLWGRLRTFSTAPASERELAIHAIAAVRTWGGVLEHPFASSLWPTAGLPRPGGERNEWGGFTLDVDQSRWGHRARKRTWLYVVGIEPRDVPAMPLRLDLPPRVINSRVRVTGKRPEVTKREREATPPELAVWLIDLARACSTTGLASVPA